MSLSPSLAEPVVLVAPLDWGLGHATRCIPLIHALLQNNCKVILAGEGNVRALLQQAFPGVEWLHLPGYRVRYSAQKWWMPFQLIGQLPNLLSSVQEEQAWLKKVVAERKIDGVISDNRYGLYHPQVPSVFITHQLRIQTFLGKRADDLLQNLHYRYINRFSECWVPDAKEKGLGGELSHPSQLPSIPVSYLGVLSRFAMVAPVQGGKHLLILLSGPEPQRTILERMLLEQVRRYKKKVVWVRGLPHAVEPLDVPANVEVFGHLPAKALEQKMREASFIVSRSGYSTVMDVMTLRQKAIFIPTPGQTEQEYLAQHLMQQNRALCIEQTRFQLGPALELAASFPYQWPELKQNLAAEVVARWINPLQSKRHNQE